jgi:hypothetical protein
LLAHHTHTGPLPHSFSHTHQEKRTKKGYEKRRKKRRKKEKETHAEHHCRMPTTSFPITTTLSSLPEMVEKTSRLHLYP